MGVPLEVRGEIIGILAFDALEPGAFDALTDELVATLGALAAGATQVFTEAGDTAKVKLVLGNAGAVELTVNGHKLGAPGSVGQVTTVSFTPGDPAAG